MIEDEASQIVVNNLKAMGYKPPSPHMQKRVEAALGVSVPLRYYGANATSRKRRISARLTTSERG